MGLENFASPGLRWGLLLVDHPGATHEFNLVKGTDIGFPKQFGGEKDFCLCTINFPERDGEQHAPVSASKEAEIKRGESDEWVVICTKTLGRALKKAGYPDDLEDLKDLMLWRKQNAQVSAIVSGTPQLAIAPSRPLEQIALQGTQQVESSLAKEAATPPALTVVPDHVDSDGVVTDAEIVPDDDPAGDSFFDRLLVKVNNLSGEDRVLLRKFLAEQNIPAASHAWSDEDLDTINGWIMSGDNG